MRLLILGVLALTMVGAEAQQPQNEFIILGTAAGPLAEADRSQPANALIVNDDVYLVDAGDGAVGQLAKAGIFLTAVDGVFLSHNHFDHTAGMLAVIGLRMQLVATEMLQIYGPPGTRAFIEGLLAAMAPAAEAGYGMPGQSWSPLVEVAEVEHGAIIELDGLSVHVAENTHFLIPEDSSEPEKAKSLSFRFELKDRSIVYTGDTGPSEAVLELARGADILISEMMDIVALMENIRQLNPNAPAQQIDGIEWHLRAHHLLPWQVGEMAADAGVGKVVVTHMSPNIDNNEMAQHYIALIAEEFDGEIEIARDLDRY